MRQIDSGTGVGIQHGERQSSVNGVITSSGADVQKPGPTTGGVRAGSENSTSPSGAQRSEHMGG